MAARLTTYVVVGIVAATLIAGLMVGAQRDDNDGPVDLATARNADTQICLARYGFGYRFAPEDFRGDELFIDSPGDLVDLLRGTFERRSQSRYIQPRSNRRTGEKE